MRASRVAEENRVDEDPPRWLHELLTNSRTSTACETSRRDRTKNWICISFTHPFLFLFFFLFYPTNRNSRAAVAEISRVFLFASAGNYSSFDDYLRESCLIESKIEIGRWYCRESQESSIFRVEIETATYITFFSGYSRYGRTNSTF